MMAKGLTAKSVEQFKPGRTRIEVPDALLAGFYLIVQPSGAKSWSVRYRHAGKPRKLTIGKYPALSLNDARDAALEALRAVAKGGDPGHAKQEAKRAVVDRADRDLFRSVVADFIARHAKPHNRSWQHVQWLFEKHVIPSWGERRVHEIRRRDVIALLDGIVDRGTATTANRVFEVVRKLFNWSIERGIVDASPCVGIKPPAPHVTRDRILNDDEIRWLWRACDTIGEPFGPLVKLLLLTGARRDEVAGMPARELHLTNEPPFWLIPPTRTKNGREHHVPLSRIAMEILGAVRRVRSQAGYVFTTSGETPVSGFSRAKKRVDEAMQRIAREEAGGDDLAIEGWTLHDLRRTAASGMARLGVAVHVVEATLNHKSGTIRGVAAVYNRYAYEPEKQAALEAWGRYISDLVTGEAVSNVVALRA